MNENKVVGRAVIVNPQGLHMRPVSEFTKIARGFAAEIRVRNADAAADGKAVIELLSLGAAQGTELVIEAVGEDAAAAVEALMALVASGFPLPADDDN